MRPSSREVPVPGSAEPTAECQPRRNRLVLEWIAAEKLTAPRECWVRVEDAETTADHDDDGNDIYPVCSPNDPVVPLLSQSPSARGGNYTASRTRVSLLVHLLQPLDAGMGVNLGRRDGRVPEQLLYRPEIGTRVE